MSKSKDAYREYELEEQVEMLEDASDYWRNEFVELYNDLVKAVTIDADDFSDGEVVDVVFDILRKYDGQSEGQLFKQL